MFVAANFDYSSARIRSLIALANNGDANVFLTDITVREIKAKIKVSVSLGVKARPDPILKNSLLPDVQQRFKSLNAEAVEKELLCQFDQFMKDADVEVLRVENDALHDVLDDYFAGMPPFGARKSKAEFPDALALHALKKWCKSENSQMAVITRDKAVQVACAENDYLNHFENLAKYLDAVDYDEFKAEFVRKSVLQNQKLLFEKAKERFSWMGFILNDQDGEVEDVELTDMEPDGEVNIISLEENWAEVEVPATFLFRAILSYQDPDTGNYDNEEGIFWDADTIRESVRRKIHRSIAAEIEFDELDPGQFYVGSVIFSGSDSIEVESSYDFGWVWPPKVARTS